ncbi:DUF4153 domain-containing protein [Nocardia sp. CC227C]|uniref:DUF4153 domain-containing protein n=1 Tax=Nocardia sp. CC227C TaxID=3044562 RepID=UPI00278BC594|nr:DUF4153 domain-containing protein [Nocardia sp. CC227C]
MPVNPADDGSKTPVAQDDSTTPGTDGPTIEPTGTPATAPPTPDGPTAAEPVAAQQPNHSAAAQHTPTVARVAFPRGVLSATALSGVAAALLLPDVRPGIGWLLTGVIVAAAIVAVDYTARRSAELAAARVPARTERTETSGVASSDVDFEASESAAVPPTGGVSVRDTEEAVGSSAPARTVTRTMIPTRGGARSEAWGTPALARLGGRVWWSALALSLLAVGAFRASEWLFVLCVLTAGVVASLAVVRRSAYGVVFDMAAVPLMAMLHAMPWLYHGLTRVRRARMSSQQRVWWSALVTFALLVVFVPLLAGADAVFATLVDGVLPSMDSVEPWRWGLLFPLAALGTAGALYLLAAPPPAAGAVVRQRVARRLSRLEWGLPVGALIILFAVFVGTQLAVLFGGDDYVQRTADLTYAEYARSGFWQLSVVSILTLAVIAVVQRWAARDSVADRAWLRAALTAVSVLTLVIVASALSRMWTYQQAYGFTVLRLLVGVFELWIAALYLLVLAGLVRLRQGWLPRAAVGAAAATLLALAIMNPERFIADRNIDRWEAGKTLDTDYLNDLSADVLPAADRLPDALRREVVESILIRLDEDTWRDWNLSRARAR